MSIHTIFTHSVVCLLIASLPASEAFASDWPAIARDNTLIHGGSTVQHKAAADTIDLMGPTGSGALYLGDFEAGWNSWTSTDLTQETGSHWQVSDYNQAVPGNLAAWCGSLEFAACPNGTDVAGGYGNNWNEFLELHLTVGDPLQSATVRVTGTLQVHTEDGEDFVSLAIATAGQFGLTNVQSWDGLGTIAVDVTVTYLPNELVDGTDIVIVWRFQSDGVWSDADCRFPTAGACQVDDITVTISQSGQTDIVDFTDFQDGSFGGWAPSNPDGVGDFAGLWNNLGDLDPCVLNATQQVAFIDDGLVVPGTGGTQCISWCYGPAGYIVNTAGGLAGPAEHIHNSIRSPVMTWPDTAFDGLTFDFDVFHYEEFNANSPGTFYFWSVRSADTDNSAGQGAQVITEQPFVDRNLVFPGRPAYERFTENVSDLLEPGRDEVQIRLGVYEVGWAWGIDGADGYPTPYFDNVALKVYPFDGPAMTVKEEDLAQDNFPESDSLDFANPGTMHVRFDAARSIAPANHMHNDPGDSIVAEIKAMRAGAVLFGPPELHYTIDAHPLFDAYRTVAVSGVSQGVPATIGGAVAADRWAFDLPDTGTLFPGDVLHYYLRAGDVVAGDANYATIPADRTGYGDFSDLSTYDRRFTVSALPTVGVIGSVDEVPRILVWDDSGDPEHAAIVYGNMVAAGAGFGLPFDFYYTNAPSQGVGNGVGGRTDGGALSRYTTIIYASGAEHDHTLTAEDFSRDPGDDIGVLSTWLGQGDRNLFLSGDGLAWDLGTNQGTSGSIFLASVLGVDIFVDEVRPFIANQVRPLVMIDSAQGVFDGNSTWIVEGGCPDIRRFDAVTVRPGATRLAEFTDQNQSPGAYSFSAATLNSPDGTDEIISMPYDELLISDPAGAGADPGAFAADIMCYVLRSFGFNSACTFPLAAPLPERKVFSLSAYPNPFNPSTRMEYSIAGPGHLRLRIYNVRGELVRTLIDGQVQTGGHVLWDGTDDVGASVASGVYFSEAEMAGEVKVNKLALIK